jgi:uncharacterized protein YndB with AHSA1/START domain
MEKLLVKKSVNIKAHADKVWEVLTQRKYTDVWSAKFSGDGVKFHLDARWKMNNPVLWKNDEGRVMVEGTVTALEPCQLLRFTVADTQSANKISFKEDDGITFKLLEQTSGTRLYIMQGDFSALEDGTKYRDQSEEIWNETIPLIKQLAETPSAEKEPTCGKGLAEASMLQAMLGDITASIAENLEEHLKTLNYDDQKAEKEDEVYRHLAKEHREIAGKLHAAARYMARQRTLPMVKHHKKELLSPHVIDTFRKLLANENNLLMLLSKRIIRDEKMLRKMNDANKKQNKK